MPDNLEVEICYQGIRLLCRYIYVNTIRSEFPYVKYILKSLNIPNQELLKCSWTVKSEQKLQSCLKLRKSQNPFCHVVLEILN